MPRRTTSVCAEPGCPALTEAERCADHERQRQRDADRNRMLTRRTYATGDARWRRLRARVLAADPVCSTCGQRDATEVDHIDGDATNNHRSNLRAMCGRCHRRKTASTDMSRDESGRWQRRDGEPEARSPRRGSAGSVPLG